MLNAGLHQTMLVLVNLESYNLLQNIGYGISINKWSQQCDRMWSFLLISGHGKVTGYNISVDKRPSKGVGYHVC